MPIKQRFGCLFGNDRVNPRSADPQIRLQPVQQLLIDFGHVSFLLGPGRLLAPMLLATVVRGNAHVVLSHSQDGSNLRHAEADRSQQSNALTDLFDVFGSKYPEKASDLFVGGNKPYVCPFLVALTALSLCGHFSFSLPS